MATRTRSGAPGRLDGWMLHQRLANFPARPVQQRKGSLQQTALLHGGADRLANAIAAQARFGGPVVVVDFGTAVTFDVVDANQNYTGGIIAPGLAAMTDYLHEKTALLPRIKIAEPKSIVGKNTEQAMLSGAVLGYRGLITELLAHLKKELSTRRLPVVATGGYAALMAEKMPAIRAVAPRRAVEGLRLVGLAHRPAWWRT